MKLDPEVGLRSGQVAGRAGINLPTLRYYERRGLVEEPLRSVGGHRLYPEKTVTLLRMIKTAQRLGFSLTEIGDMLAVYGRHRALRVDSPLHTCMTRKLAELDERIDGLVRMRDALESVLDTECSDVASCIANLGCPV